MELWEIVARESVRQTLADYTGTGDGRNLTDFADCFTPDGVLHIRGRDPFVGRDAIVAGLQEALVLDPSAMARLTHVRHHVSSIRFISVTPDRIEATAYFVVFTDVGADHWGRYRDVFVPNADRWRFAKRSVSVDEFAETSLMRPPAAT